MAKFFRFIVNLCIICFLLTGAALIAPQFAGITTVIVDEEITDTNQSIGSVVYGRSVPLDQLKIGDKLLRSTNTTVYVSEIKTADAAGGVYTVEGKDGAEEEVTLRGSANKALITVPFIGYVSIAMQTFEGRIILGLALAFLIILFILSEIWKNNEENEEDEDEDEDEEDELPGKLSREERKARKKEEKRRKKLEKQGVTEDTEDTEEEPPAETMKELREPEETEESEKSEEAEEFVLEPADELEEENEEVSEGEKDMADVDLFTAAIQAALESEVDQESEEESSAEQPEAVEEIPVREEEPEEPRKLAIPILTKEEILEKAHTDGDDPKVIEDKEDGIVFIDYSDVL